MTRASIGPSEVARATGVSTDALRHYERKGLLADVTRTAAGYRRYSSASVERVLLIRRALVMGFSIADLKGVLAVRDGGGAPCRSVRALAGERLDDLNRRIEELLTLRDELRQLLAEWDGKLSNTPQGERAHLLEAFVNKPVIERTRQKRQLQPGRSVRATRGAPIHPRR